MSTADVTPDFDILNPAFLQNPYPTMRRMREEAPVYRYAPLNAFLLTRYDHVDALTRDGRFSSDRLRLFLNPIFTGEEGERRRGQWARLMFFLDGQRHARIRSYVNRATGPVSLESMRPMIASVVQGALAPLREQREADLVSAFADPVALAVITEMFAVPEEDRAGFRVWMDDVLKPAGIGLSSPEVVEEVKRSSDALFGYMLALAEERRVRPGADIISRFIAATDGDPELSADVSYQCINLIGAGYITVRNQISNAVLAFLRHPAELQRLREDPGLLKGAIEEAIRYDSSVLAMSRVCVEEAEIGGVPIAPGELVFGLVAGANHDPAVFPEPERFDITRKDGRHMAFGSGPHYCPGAALTRMQVEEALRALLTLPRLELGDQPCEYRTSNLQDRGPSLLPVRLG